MVNARQVINTVHMMEQEPLYMLELGLSACTERSSTSFSKWTIDHTGEQQCSILLAA